MAQIARGLYIHHNHISRVQGQSLVASIAYRTCTRLQDERREEIHDYTRKQGLIQAELFGPESVLERYRDYEGAALYERLSNDYEQREDQSTRPKQALLGRELIAALPRECDHAQGWEIACAMGDSIRKRGLVAVMAFHESDSADQGKNPHLLMLILPRHIAPDGSFGKRYEALDPRGKRSEREVQKIREEYIRVVNAKMAKWGIETNFHLKKEAEQNEKAITENQSRDEPVKRMQEEEDLRRAADRTITEDSKSREEMDQFIEQVSWWKARLADDGHGKGKRDRFAIAKYTAALQAARSSAMAARDARLKSEGAVTPTQSWSKQATYGVRHGARLSAGLSEGGRQR